MKAGKTLILLLFSFFIFTSFVQVNKADSLLQLVNATTEAAAKASYLNELGNFYRYTNLDSASKYTLQAIALAGQNNLHHELTKAYTELGIIWYAKSHRDSSEFYLNRAYEIARKNKNYWGMLKSLNSTIIYKTKAREIERASEAITEALGYVDKVDDLRLTSMLYNNIAIYNKANGHVEEALEYYHKALTLSEQQNNKKSIGLISSNMGLLYEQQNNTDLALKYLKKSLAIRQDINNKLGESYVRTNMGLVYENLENYDEALEQYRKSLAIKQEIGSSKGIPILYNNIGIIFKKQALYDSAFYYCNKALELRIKFKDKLGEARTRTTIGQVHFLTNNTKEAEKELQQALQLASKYRNFSVLQNVYSSLYQVYSKQKNYKTANYYLLRNNDYKDSIFNIQKERSIASIEAKYHALKKEKKNLQLIQESELKDSKIRRQLIIGFGLIGILFLFVLLLLLVYRSRNKLSAKNKEIEQQKEQLSKAYKKLKRLSEFKEAMTNMLVHDLKNPLNVIANYKALKNMDSFDELVQQSGYTMENLVHNILDVYKYQNTSLELNKTDVSISENIRKAIDEISFLAKNKKLKFNFNFNKEYIVFADEVILKRVFVNIFSNAIKYTPNSETICLNCSRSSDKTIRISIGNPGPSIPRDKQKLIFEYFKQADRSDVEDIRSNGLGLSFCKLAIEAHNGEIGVISENETGVEFWFTLPDVKQEIPLNNNSIFNWVSR